MKPEAITFQATFGGMRTTVDGGVRITLDLVEVPSEIVKNLLDAKEKLLSCAIVPD
jgi:hypothetical protein